MMMYCLKVRESKQGARLRLSAGRLWPLITSDRATPGSTLLTGIILTCDDGYVADLQALGWSHEQGRIEGHQHSAAGR